MSENDASMDAYRTVLKDLKRRKKVIEAAIAGVTALLGESEAALQACLPAPLPKIQESGDDVTSGAFADLTLTEAAQIYLSTVKDPQSTADIADALKRGGYPTESRNFRNTVRSVLDRHSKTVGAIVKVHRNWGLAEWNRGKGK
ncbi:MAG: hypothetical protein F4090_04880 [Nitrospira sp. SB0672_bin_25]|nr:hypothetical protein [Nitrospira sp. SB0666_bin_27]MYF25110.1 hypothetical protein [Nitrospira sp. SB0678_bin_10]MYJ54227.1 hypothetical protein [Nitrospira sp. SB0672_bin_25]